MFGQNQEEMQTSTNGQIASLCFLPGQLKLDVLEDENAHGRNLHGL